ncbi:DUF4199 domain-containing protein [Raineya orbicola]|jgi:hypothetical protein|uniref:DUF4199 domain-containing protein n=1 Tax=Raineya orbicola TaxID=2016530 RepID=A0A2N3IK53_9BACT|nr:DUF4199 domain-containing protein [Raineya orbicola]PKQ70593.1 hypothetical protein Rain11_0323 [Raineya orbicola]
MEQKITTTQVGFRYGIIYGLTSIAISLITIIADLQQNFAITLLNIFVLVAFLVIPMRYFKSQNEGFMSFGQGMGIGSIVSALSNFILGLFILVYYRFIAKHKFEEILEKARESWEKAGMKEEQMQMAEKFTTPEVMFVSTLIGGTIFGILISLIVSAVLQKKKPEF